jgi:hypothetical protein
VTDEDKLLARQLAIKHVSTKYVEQQWLENMSFQMFMLAKETGITVTPETNMIVVFDMLDNLNSYIDESNVQTKK